MAKFTTRVELHDADSDDYETLHSAMKSKGFTRYLTDSDGVKWTLPTAEYNYVGNATKSEVLEKAKAAAKQTKLKHEILVTKSDGRTWYNLKKT
jgi:hypothetical protein